MPSIVARAAAVVIAAITIFALYWAREVIIPVVLALFLTLLLSPLVRVLERSGIRRFGAVVIVLVASYGAIGGVLWIVGSQAGAVIAEFPKYRDNIVDKARNLHGRYSAVVSRITKAAESFQGEVAQPTSRPTSGENREGELAAATNSSQLVRATSAPAPQRDEPIKVEVVSRESQILTLVRELTAPVVHPFATMGVATVFLAFFLIYREELRDRVVRACGRANVSVTTLTLADAGARVSRFFVAQVTANATVGTAIGLGFFVFGIPHAVLWGIMAALLRFIPYLGPILAAVFPAAMCVAIFDGWLPALFVIGWTVLIDVLSANLVEPWLFASRVGASPTAIMIAFVFWGWLWGGIGLILATPITVCLIALGRHIQAMEMFYVLLGNEPVLEPELRFYQRLLALDRADAVADARRFAEEHSSLEMVDKLLLPVLAQIEHDRLTNMLDERRVEHAKVVVNELVEFIRNQEPDPANAAPGLERRDVWLIVPDNGTFDTCITQLLGAMLRVPEDRLQEVSADALSTDVVQRVRELKPTGVAFVAIEPSSLNRILHKKRRMDLAGLTELTHVLIVGAWKSRYGHDRQSRRIDGVPIFEDFSQLLDLIQRRAVYAPNSGEATEDSASPTSATQSALSPAGVGAP